MKTLFVQFFTVSAVLLLPSTFLSVVGGFRKRLAQGPCATVSLQTTFERRGLKNNAQM